MVCHTDSMLPKWDCKGEKSMSESEAIRIIKNEKFWETNERICEAFEMAINALEEKQNKKENI